MIDADIKVLSTTSILYVNDSKESSKLLIEKLKSIFKNIHIANNEFEALKIYQENKPNFIIADMSMKRINVINFIKKIRQVDTKIQIALTYINDNLNEILKAVEFGLAKIILKPFTDIELKNLFKIFANSYTEKKVYSIAPLWTFESNNYTIKGPTQTFTVTKKECSFLNMLFKENQTITYCEMKNYIWNDSQIHDNVLHTFIKNIRKKLPAKSLINVPGIGYRIDS